MLMLPPLSLYVHLPWCARKCPYCDFNSHERSADLPDDEYVGKLLLDLEADLHWVQNRSLASIFIGGGTPSLFSVSSITALLRGIRERLPLQIDAEITLEANPGSAESEKFQGIRIAGVNRLSIGVQSFADDSLRALGRVHDARQAHAAITAAKAAGFLAINIDLMHGLPHQTPAMALEDLRQALAHGVPHISWYQLTLEPNTVFYRSPPPLPAEDELAEIQDLGDALLKSHGYQHYEVSAYARPGHRCCHNGNYWHFGDYIGIGAGAHGKITLPQQGALLRTWKTRSPKDYLALDPQHLGGQSTVAREELALEYLMNALRLREGADAVEFSARTGLEYAEIAAAVAQLQNDGLMIGKPGALCTTDTGFRFLNSVLERFS